MRAGSWVWLRSPSVGSIPTTSTNIMNTDWSYKQDPHGIVPTGYHSSRNHYTVRGFCAPAGKEPKWLMVYIKYDGDRCAGHSTTLKYLSVLYDYFNSLDHTTFVERHIR